MASPSELLDALRSIRTQGASGTRANNDLESRLEEVSRRSLILEEVAELLISHTIAGPEWGRFHLVKAADCDANGYIKVTHNLGYNPTNWIISRIAAPLSSSGPSPESWGSIRLVNSNDSTATFQFDQWAQDPAISGLSFGNKVSFRLIPFANRIKDFET